MALGEKRKEKKHSGWPSLIASSCKVMVKEKRRFYSIREEEFIVLMSAKRYNEQLSGSNYFRSCGM